MAKLLCGIDLGGTKLSVGLVKTDGTLVDKVRTHDHVNKDENSIISDMAVLVNELLNRNGLSEENLLGIGVVFPGHIRSMDGISITTSNLAAQFKNFPFRASIQKHFPKTTVHVDNDANAQAYAEFKYGAGKNYTDMVFITASTGIGAGIILGGKLIRGMSGTAGEVGHTIINPNSTKKCTCGNYGCLMSQACGRLLPQVAAEKLESGVTTNLGITLENVKSTVTGYSIGKGLELDDELAKCVVFECADSLGIAIYNLFQLLNPQIIILGGGLMNWGDIYLDRIKAKFNQLARDMMYDEMKIVTSKLGENSGILGASSLCLETL
jgi:glucokinase